MSNVHTISCSEIWGGIRGEELNVQTSGIRACLYSKSCDGGKGGDIYYFSVCGSDLLSRIAIVDVMGHGEAVSDTSQWLYDSLVSRMNSGDGNEVLTDLNKASVEKGYKAMSTATIAAFYSENSTLYYSYAGHHEILLYQKSISKWTELSDDIPEESEDDDSLVGLPLGVQASCEFSQQSIHAEVGDRLFIYTDGVIEAMNSEGTLFSTERLIKVLEQHANAELSTVRQAVLNELIEYTGGTLDHDDVTFMILEIIDPNSN